MPAFDSSQEKIYSVSQLNRETRLLLNEHFFSIRVEGEISNLSTPSSGHLYFSLKDDAAQIRCAMFRHKQRSLAFKPENGQQVILTAQVSLYEPRGDFQLIVEQMEEAGDGLLRRQFEQLKQKLLAEGLFADSRKRPLPELPRLIGIITSPTGAAVHDILSVLKRRFPAIPVIIYPTAVQGDSAKTEIVSAIRTANQQQKADILLLARGGGSMEDLWAFNEEIVARAIADSKIPIISAIGHEVDFTISDFVADMRAPTPSAAAEHAVPNQQEWLNTFKAYEAALQQLMEQKLEQSSQLLDWFNRSLQQLHPGRQLQRNVQHLGELEKRLLNAWQKGFNHRTHQFEIIQTRLNSCQPADTLLKYKQQLNYLQHQLTTGIQSRLEYCRQQLSANVQTLQTVSPLATLERGYSITRQADDNGIIKSAADIKTGDLIETLLADGRIKSQVLEISEKPPLPAKLSD